MKDTRIYKTMEELKITKQEQKAEVVALRNQLLGEVKKSVKFEADDRVSMKKKDYDILIRDWENTTRKHKKDI